ncbi:MAG: replicative DNA helicase [Gammaproteobacteria bacterium]
MAAPAQEEDRAVERLKVPPHSVEAERAVLGGLMLDNSTWEQIGDRLRAEDFYRRDHQLIFAALDDHAERAAPFDVVTVSDWLKARGELEAAGGMSYLIGLTRDTPSAVNVRAYADIVTERGMLRELIRAGGDIAGSAFATEGRELAEIVDAAEKLVFEIADRGSRRGQGFRPINLLLKDTVDRLHELQNSKSHITGLPTGITDLDEYTAGLQPGELIVIAGRPSMGKTSLAMNIAENVAISERRATAIFSLEMPAVQLTMRLVSSLGRIDQSRLRTGRLEDFEWPRVTSVIELLSDAPIYVDDSGALSPTELRARARRLKRDAGNLSLIVIDYLQLMQVPGTRENRATEISEISRTLKALAKELALPIVALSQLNRGVEQRPNKRPVMSDLRESGCLTGDALVTLADSGERRRIDELAGFSRPFKVWTLDPATLQLTAATVSRAFATGVKSVYKLKTRLGRTIRATGNHKFLTIRGWERLDHIGIGSHIALPRKLPAAATRSMSDTELALLGHLLGDGCTLPRHSLQYTTREHDLAELVAKFSVQLFGADIAPCIKPERSWYQVYLRSTRHHTHGVRNAVSEWLDELGVWGLRSYEKFVPKAVFTQPAEQIACLMRHLWATDGCIRMVASKSPRSPRSAVYYATSSERLAQDVQALLLRLGINARLSRVSQADKGRDQFHVIVSGRDDVMRFADVVGAVGSYRQASLDEMRTHNEQLVANTNRDVIPAEIWELFVKPAMARFGITHRQLHRDLAMSYSGMTIFSQNVSRERAERLAAAVSSEELKSLAESDVYWDSIVGIEEDGVEPVYDLTVPETHNFVANDIIVHNSIEQDADVVMMLYRDEYYNENSPEKGLAEIHIVKQRNGPTGTVKVAFLERHTRFENYIPESALPENFR